MPLITPVTDRTEGNTGYWDETVANRIETNCIYLQDLLRENGYHTTIHSKVWTKEDFPYWDEIDRIRDNVNALVDGFHKMTGSPDIRYVRTLNWNDANSLEQNLLNVDVLLTEMIAALRYSGEIYSGEDDLT